MCRRAPRCVMLGLAAVLVAPGPAFGQQTEKELVEHLDSLVPLLRPAQQRAAQAQVDARKARDTKIALDTVLVGPLKVLVVPGEGDAALDVVGDVWQRDYASWVEASPTLATQQIFFQWSADLVEYSSSSLSVHTVQGSRWQPRSYMEKGVREVISRSLRGDLLGTRLDQDWTVVAIREPEDPATIYRQVVLASSRAAGGCLQGDLDLCLGAFGLAPTGTSVNELYTPQERFLLVQQNAARFRVGAPQELLACLSGDLGPCDRLLQDYVMLHPSAQLRLWTVPFGPDVRASLLWFALQRGGTGAWGRLLAAADGEPVAALEAASGVDRHTLMREWRTWLLDNRPARQAGLGVEALTGAVWAFLLIALAARSTRWRFA